MAALVNSLPFGPVAARFARDVPLPPDAALDPIIHPAVAIAVPAPAPAPPPPTAAGPSSTAGAPFSIQTIGVDVPDDVSPGSPASSSDSDWVVVSMEPTVGAEATAAPESESQQGNEVDEDEGGGGSGDNPNRPPPPPPGNGECRLMGPFALFVQLGLGGLALMSLVYKRWRERPQRPLKIWFFDASKQVFGSVLMHIANVFMSLLTSGRFSIKLDPEIVATGARLLRRDDEPYVPNPCSFYLLNLAIDTTLGIPILIFLLRVLTALVSRTPLGNPPESIQSGNYGHPPNAWWWLKQSVLYFCGLFGMKTCVLIIFLTMPWIAHVGDWALSWTAGNEQVQIVFVMMLFPLIMNAMQYYIIDSFIKEQAAPEHAPRQHHHDRAVLYDHLSDNSADDEDSGDDDGFHSRSRSHRESAAGGNNNNNGGGDGSSGEEEELEDVLAKSYVVETTPSKETPVYDPEHDGDSPTVIGSSSSQRSHTATSEGLPKALYPQQ